MSTGNLSQPFDQLQSHRDNPIFKESCSRIDLLTKPFEQSKISTILKDDHPEQAVIVDGDGAEYFWYLVIGSMLNPVSLCLRNITPLVSFPARCPYYQLVFRDHRWYG